jgi:hypothetical protein
MWFIVDDFDAAWECAQNLRATASDMERRYRTTLAATRGACAECDKADLPTFALCATAGPP